MLCLGIPHVGCVQSVGQLGFSIIYAHLYMYTCTHTRISHILIYVHMETQITCNFHCFLSLYSSVPFILYVLLHYTQRVNVRDI